jgi:hypothetical protein
LISFPAVFQQFSSVKIADTVGSVVHNDAVTAARSSPDRRRSFTELGAARRPSSSSEHCAPPWNGCAAKDAEMQVNVPVDAEVVRGAVPNPVGYRDIVRPFAEAHPVVTGEIDRMGFDTGTEV